MAEQVIGRAVVETVVDGSGISAGFADIRAEVGRFQQAVGQGVSQAAQQVTDATTKLDSVTGRYVKSIEREIAAVTLSREAYRAWEAQVKNVSEGVYAPLVSRLQEAISARNAEAKAALDAAQVQKAEAAAKAATESADRKAALAKADYIAKLREEIAVFGMTPQQRDLRSSEQRGGPEAAQLTLQLQNLKAAQEAVAETAQREAAAQRDAARAKAESEAADMRAKQTKDTYLASLREEIRLALLTPDQRAQRVAGQRGGPEAAQLVAQLQNVTAAQESANRAARDQAAALNSADAARRQFIEGVERQARAIGKTNSELLEMRAAELGVANSVAPAIAALRKQEQALAQNSKALAGNNMSQKQYNAALRGVPAQITDIVVSLQGGQAPLTVLLQQGGQLKDMFNGIVPAIRAVGGAVLDLLTNRLVVAGAAVAALTYAYYQGSQEQDNFVKGLATTGDRAGVTVGQLTAAARAVSTLVGTQAQAAGALNALVTAGGVTGIQDLTRYAETAVRAQRLLGTAVEDTAKAYADLGKDPVRAVERLNETMSFLTQRQYEQIRALADNNRQTEAAAVAQRAYDRAVNDAASAVEQNLGIVQRAWRAAGDAAAWAWDKFLGIGRAPQFADKINEVEANLRRISQMEALFGAGSGGARKASEDERAALNRNQLRQMENAMDKARSVEDNRAAIAATEDVKRWEDRAKGVSAVDRELKKYRASLEAIRKVNPESASLDPARVKATEAAIRAANAGPKAAAPKQFQDDEATRYLIRLKEVQGALAAQLESENKLTDAQKERAKFEAQIVELRGKGKLTDDQKSLVRDQGKIRAQLDVNVAVAEEVRLKAEREKLDKAAAERAAQYAAAYERLQATIATNAESRSEAITKALSGVGRGDVERQRLEDQRQLNREFDKYVLQLERAAITAGRSVDGTQVAAIRAQQAAALAEAQNYYAALDALQSDWTNGATRALENYYDSSRNIADQIGEAFTNAFDGLEDVLNDFANTGKLSFSNLAQSIVADINRIIIKAQIMGPLTQALQGQMSSGSGFGGLLSGGLSALFGGGFTAGGTQGMSWSYPKAGGGWAPANSLQYVNENGPELLTMNGRTALMMGKQGGQVTPTGAGGGRLVTLHYHAAPGVDRRTNQQYAADAARQLAIADQRNN